MNSDGGGFPPSIGFRPSARNIASALFSGPYAVVRSSDDGLAVSSEDALAGAFWGFSEG